MDGVTFCPFPALLIERGFHHLQISPLEGEMPGRAEGGIAPARADGRDTR